MPKPKGRVTGKVRSRVRKVIKEPAFEGIVRDIASDGRAVVGHPDGRTFFVSGAWLGERLRILPAGRQGKVGVGALLDVLEPADGRREAPCSHHGYQPDRCGGCAWLFVDYADQLVVKQRRLATLIINMGIDGDVLQPIIAAPEELGYRNRAQLKTDGERLGYMAAGSNQLVDVVDCPVLSQKNQITLADLRKQLPQREWRPDKRRGRHWHTLHIDDQIDAFQFNQRLPFRQGNSAQNARMRAWLTEVIAPIESDAPVLELFAGSGNFTSILGQHFHAVVAAEGGEGAVSVLDDLGLRGVTSRQCDLFADESMEALLSECGRSRVLVVDPPRDGLVIRAPILRQLKQLEWVIYISCDPATWSRDSRDFMAEGFVVEQVTPIDVFPQTPHIEVLSVLRRRT